MILTLPEVGKIFRENIEVSRSAKYCKENTEVDNIYPRYDRDAVYHPLYLKYIFIML